MVVVEVNHQPERLAVVEPILEFPVTVGLVGLVLAPVLAAIGAIAVFAADFTIVVTRDQPGEKPKA